VNLKKLEFFIYR